MTSTPAPTPSGTPAGASVGSSAAASTGAAAVADGPVVVAPTIDIVRAVVGGVFLGVFAYWRKPSPLAIEWSEMLLLLAALVIVPLTVGIFLKSVTSATARMWELIERMHLSAAALLIGAYLMRPGIAVGGLTLPWLAITFLYALAGIVSIRERSTRTLGGLTINVGFIFLAVGGVWVFIERAGFRPWGFESNIEILTAVHFHYAGFVLLLAAGWAAKELHESRLAKLACITAMIGVPLTAAGILITQMTHGKLAEASMFEVIGSIVMALAGALVAWMHLLLAGRSQYTPLVRTLWSIASASLIAAMALAALYGLRTAVPIKLLDIPHMWAIHGTLNAVGFGLCVVSAWRSRFRRPRGVAV